MDLDLSNEVFVAVLSSSGKMPWNFNKKLLSNNCYISTAV